MVWLRLWGRLLRFGLRFRLWSFGGGALHGREGGLGGSKLLFSLGTGVLGCLEV